MTTEKAPTTGGGWGMANIPTLRQIHLWPIADDVYHRPDECPCNPRVGVGEDPDDPTFEPVYQFQHRPNVPNYDETRPTNEPKKLLPWGAKLVITEDVN